MKIPGISPVIFLTCGTVCGIAVSPFFFQITADNSVLSSSALVSDLSLWISFWGAIFGAGITTSGALFVAIYTITHPKREAMKQVQKQIKYCQHLVDKIKTSDSEIKDCHIAFVGGAS